MSSNYGRQDFSTEYEYAILRHSTQSQKIYYHL
jgi:hypothetical protein